MSDAAGAGKGPGPPLRIGPTRERHSADDPVTAAWDALGCVYDPELCLDVVSLGLVYAVREENGRVVVEMTLTTPGCPAAESMPEMARVAVADAIGPSIGVDVCLVWDPPWSPVLMREDAAATLGLRMG